MSIKLITWHRDLGVAVQVLSFVFFALSVQLSRLRFKRKRGIQRKLRQIKQNSPPPVAPLPTEPPPVDKK